MLFPTTIVGSYPQPDWLIDRVKLAGRFPPRVRAKELWRVAEPHLQQAMDDATVLAIKAQEDAGLDPLLEAVVRRRTGAEAGGIQGLPLAARAQDVEDGIQAHAVVLAWPTAAEAVRVFAEGE